MSEVVCTLLFVAGTMHSVLTKGSVLISGSVHFSICTVCSWDHVYGVLIKGGLLISEVVLYTSLCSKDHA